MRLFSSRLIVFITAGLFISCDHIDKMLGAHSKKDSPDNSHPAWSYQSTIYEVNVRQYTPEGNFAAFEKSLPRLKEMGVDILWFMPITPIGLEGRKDKPTDLGSYYAVKDYYGINPEFGTMTDWKHLVKSAHESGFKVLIDWVPNHSAPDNPWITKHPDFYKKDSTGKAAIPYDWSDTRQLNYDNREFRDTMINAMKWWIKETDIDGFRCDVAWNVPDDFWKEAIPKLREMKQVFMLAEGDKPSLNEAGFDATYTWSVNNIAYNIYSGKSSVKQLDSVFLHNDSLYPKNSFRMYFTSNHDENSKPGGTEFERFGDAAKTFAVWAFTIKSSVPLIYSGQEEPIKKHLKFFVKDTIPFSQYAYADFYKTLNTLRKSAPALSADASYKKIDAGNKDAVYAYVREKDGNKVLVILNLSPQKQSITVTDADLAGNPLNVFTGRNEQVNATPVPLEAWQFLVFNYPAHP